MTCPRAAAEHLLLAERGRLELLVEILVVELVGLGVLDRLPPDPASVDWLPALAHAPRALGGALGAAVTDWFADLGHAADDRTADAAREVHRLAALWRRGTVLMGELRLVARHGPSPLAGASGRCPAG